MSYLAVGSDGSTQQLGVITGYRVEYMQGARKKTTKIFPFLWQALGFQKTMRMGQSSKLVPVYSAGNSKGNTR